MNYTKLLHKFSTLSLYFSASTIGLAQLTWDPEASEPFWDTGTDAWNDGENFVIWDNSGSQEAIFTENGESFVEIGDGGVNVGDITLEPGSVPITFLSFNDNLGRITIIPGGATWDLGGRELEFVNDQISDTPLSISSGDTLTIIGGGEFDTGERPNDADWVGAGATLNIADPTLVRGANQTVGNFGLVQMVAESTYVHERNAGQTYPNNWEITGNGNLTFTNRFARSIILSGAISGTGGITV